MERSTSARSAGAAARGASSVSSPSQRTASRVALQPVGDQAAADDVASATRSAAAPSSRSILRYQWVLPSSSLMRRKLSSPASGSAPSANQPSITGSSWRWMAARRLTPEVSAAMCRIAPAGSR